MPKKHHTKDCECDHIDYDIQSIILALCPKVDEAIFSQLEGKKKDDVFNIVVNVFILCIERFLLEFLDGYPEEEFNKTVTKMSDHLLLLLKSSINKTTESHSIN